MGTRFESLDDPGFQGLFDDFEYSAYRLESLQVYGVPYELAEFERFRSGEARGEFPGIAEWAERVARRTREGRRFHRVHVVIEPLSDYVRFECAWCYRHTVAAGEEVRMLAVAEGQWPEGLPQADYWLFDSARLVRMDYADDGTFIAAEVVDDPEQVVAANVQRDRAVYLSVPFGDFAADFDDLMRRR
ncbi:hypothetical protein CLV63_114160 [Murinocardiopsis flavida]|uniref:DUF6879 domain-containing protein n=1 Tax=Murinocardiopsis flavida TaxID=645275 RepID=A0A2P8DEW5_9ACTN|nr:DUF6879 family protein [Murinocardiopsis flavida]PSK95727.1 hypothetical protein CLV63_114160 [Murinocardiopsis flavida]